MTTSIEQQLLLLQSLGGTCIGLLLGFLTWYITSRFINRYVRNDTRIVISKSYGSRWVYIVVFLGMSIAGGYVTWSFNSAKFMIAVLLVTTILLIVALVDFAVRRIPNEMVLALMFWAVVQVIWIDVPTPLSSFSGFLVGGGIFLLLALVGRGALGMGDVKLVAAEGVLLGFPLILNAIFWGIVFGGIVALILLVTRRAGRKDSFAYGPYLALGAWIVYFMMMSSLL